MNDEQFTEAVFDAVMGLAAAVSNVRKSGLPAGLAFEGESVEIAVELEGSADPRVSMAVVSAAMAAIHEEYEQVLAQRVPPRIPGQMDLWD